jgi:diacylglycerol kinase family enzyme
MGDGIFEVMLIRAARNVNEIPECIMAVQNQTYNCGMITFRPAKTVKITADPFVAWTLDGEKADGYKEVTVENLHHAIKIVKRGE